MGAAWVEQWWSSGEAVVGHAAFAPLIYVYDLLIWEYGHVAKRQKRTCPSTIKRGGAA